LCRWSKSFFERGIHVANRDWLAGFGVRHQTIILVLVVEVVHRGDRLCPAAQCRVFQRIDDTLAAKPDFTAVAQAREKLCAGPSRHECSSLLPLGASRRPLS
jgi:hypothetical protein